MDFISRQGVKNLGFRIGGFGAGELVPLKDCVLRLRIPIGLFIVRMKGIIGSGIV